MSEPCPAYDVSLSRCESEGIAGVVVGERGTGLAWKFARHHRDFTNSLHHMCIDGRIIWKRFLLAKLMGYTEAKQGQIYSGLRHHVIFDCAACLDAQSNGYKGYVRELKRHG